MPLNIFEQIWLGGRPRRPKRGRISSVWNQTNEVNVRQARIHPVIKKTTPDGFANIRIKGAIIAHALIRTSKNIKGWGRWEKHWVRMKLSINIGCKKYIKFTHVLYGITVFYMANKTFNLLFQYIQDIMLIFRRIRNILHDKYILCHRRSIRRIYLVKNNRCGS